MSVNELEWNYADGEDPSAKRCKLYWCDTVVELFAITGEHGDLGYADDVNRMFSFSTVWTWDVLLVGSDRDNVSSSAGVASATHNHKLDDLTAPDDNTDLNASTAKHGLLRKLDNDSSHYLDGQGNWTTPAGGGGGSSDLSMVASSNRSIAADKAGLAVRKYTINSGVILTIASGSIFRVL